jgi:hypothetical protein
MNYLIAERGIQLWYKQDEEIERLAQRMKIDWS